MKNISWRRFSVLGIVLMGASAVTAAVLPNKTDSKPLDVTGSLTLAGTFDGVAVFSCTITAVITAPCTVTSGSATTVGTAANSFVSGFQTVNNTTTV
ncbi:hypothetical protein [Chitinophaga sp. CF418]|uniref:hypothetical protein n=1 Tax=Chitinophaga sp. CF418 TaxID=1855287 RepID=UPI000921921D|nr:hypothetical protein [Chitinophaga sp. CF418]SHM37134.1 hypothetical protein SAMN05216311_10228 [Chitinophaga sp. CF418]